MQVLVSFCLFGEFKVSSSYEGGSPAREILDSNPETFIHKLKFTGKRLVFIELQFPPA